MRKFQVSSIERLPVELLSQIFILATHSSIGVAYKEEHLAEDAGSDHVPSSSSYLTGASTSGDKGQTPIRITYPPLDVNSYSVTCPVSLSSVSHNWRRISLSEAKLWTTIVTTADDALTGTPDLRGMHMFVARARHAPLDILIDLRDPEWDFCDPYPLDVIRECHIRSALSVLLPHMYRWRSFALLTDTFTPMHAALSIFSSLPRLNLKNSSISPAPLLQSLVLMRCNEYACHTANFHPPHLHEPSFAPFHGMYFPCLQNFQLVGTHLAWSSLLSSLPLYEPFTTGLRVLEISYLHQSVSPTPLYLRTVLSACPGLQRLSIKLAVPEHDAEDFISATKAELPRLIDLSLTYGAAVDAASFIATIHAPAVTHLELEDGAHPAETTIEDASLLLYVIAGLSQSRPPHSSGAVFPFVQSMVLRGVQARGHAFVALYRSLSELRSLEIEDATPGPLIGLMPSKDGVVPCTKLRRLRIAALPEAMVTGYEITGVRAAAGAALLDVEIIPADLSPEGPFDSNIEAEADAAAHAAVYGSDDEGSNEAEWGQGNESEVEELITPEPGTNTVVMMSAAVHPLWMADVDAVLRPWSKAKTHIYFVSPSIGAKAI